MERDEARKELREYLGRAQDIDFLRLIWSVEALQSDRPELAKQHLVYPSDAAKPYLETKFGIYPWDLEILATSLLLGPKVQISEKKPRLEGRHFGEAANAVNILRKIEKFESGLTTNQNNIMLELHRIAQRQFPWQRGFVKPQNVYRYLYSYGQGCCAEHFEAKYGISMSNFTMCAFALFYEVYSQQLPLVPDASGIGISNETLEAALAVLATTPDGLRGKARSLRLDLRAKNKGADVQRTIYQPNVLRHFPVVRVADRLLAPLPDLVIYRATAGLFYDLIGNSELIKEANQRFEEYCCRLISSYFSDFEVMGEQTFIMNNSPAKTPDILVKARGEIVMVFECKAAKLTFEAQYADDPMAVADRQYRQMSQGIYQLWKFFSNVRRGLYTAENVSTQAVAVLLTLDSWFAAAGELRQAVINAATVLAYANSNITKEDMRQVAFCSADELEDLIGWATPETFITTFEKASESQYLGWSIASVQRDEGLRTDEWNEFKLDLEEVMPWWGMTQG